MASVLLVAGLLLLSSLPLYFAVTLIGGKTSVMKILFLNFLMVVVYLGLNLFLDHFIGLASFVILLFLYKYFFEIGFVRALIAWVLQGVIALVLIWLFIGFTDIPAGYIVRALK
tara:strand:+ start:221 stop:562 length:342 start_codon:yes stop_codon:yes gene_type:complete